MNLQHQLGNTSARQMFKLRFILQVLIYQSLKTFLCHCSYRFPVGYYNPETADVFSLSWGFLAQLSSQIESIQPDKKAAPQGSVPASMFRLCLEGLAREWQNICLQDRASSVNISKLPTTAKRGDIDFEVLCNGKTLGSNILMWSTATSGGQSPTSAAPVAGCRGALLQGLPLVAGSLQVISTERSRTRAEVMMGHVKCPIQ